MPSLGQQLKTRKGEAYWLIAAHTAHTPIVPVVAYAEKLTRG